jgi:hypothetical protein
MKGAEPSRTSEVEPDMNPPQNCFDALKDALDKNGKRRIDLIAPDVRCDGPSGNLQRLGNGGVQKVRIF